MFQTFISRHNSNFFSDKLVLTSVTPASSAPVLQTPKATSSTLYFDSLTVNAGNGGFLHCIQMDTSVNAANQVVSVGADIAFDADPKFFACLVRFESSSVPTTLPTAYDVYPLDGRHDGGYYTVKDCVTIDVLPRTPCNNGYVGFMFGAIAGGIASALAGGAMSKLFGGGQKAASGGIQGDVLATDNNTVGMGDAGIKSAIQGSNVPNPDEAVPSFVSGSMAKAGKGLLEGTLQAGTSAVSDKLLDLVGLGGKSAADKGKDTRDYLAAAFPELNAWERAGADASSAGMVDAGFENQKELTKMQLDNQKEIAEMQNETQKEIAGIQSATSRQNTKDQVYAQNEMLAYQQKESTARVASIMENTNLSKQQQVSEIMRQMLTQAQTAGQYFTNDQIKEMTSKVSAEVDLVHQQTQNQRYGSSHIGATAKDISNVVTDAASGVVDIFHGIDKAVADTWNNFWKDGKADGIGSNLSRK